MQALLRTLLALGAMLLVVASVSAQPALTVVRVGIVPADDATPLVYGIRSGLFRDAGLDVQMVFATSGSVIAAAVLAQSDEIGNSSFATIINAHLRGVPLEMIAAQAAYDEKAPYGQFVVAMDSDYKRAQDLNGKTIGTATLNDLDSLASQAWLDKNGGDSKSLHFVEVPQSAVATAVAEHRIDGSVMRYPMLADAIATHKVKAIYPIYSAIAPSYVFGGYCTSKDYAEKHPDVIRRFAQTLYRAAAYTNAHPADTVEMMAEMTKVPAETLAHMVRVHGSTSLRTTDMQPIIDTAARYGAIPHSFPAADLLQYAPRI